MPKVNLNQFEKDILKAAEAGFKRAANTTEEHLKQNASLTDHSLARLEEMGNPYSTDNYRQIHDPKEQVHRQSNRLYNSIKQVREDPKTIAIGANAGEVPYLHDVINGNSRMVARDFPKLTLSELVDSDILYGIMEVDLKKVKL